MTLTIETTERQTQRTTYALDNIDALTRSQNDGRRIVLTKAIDVKIERPVFLYKPLVPMKGLTLIAGRAGVSKSTLSIDIAAKATRGKLEGDYSRQPINVVFAAIEDDTGMQKARLEAAGADMSRIIFLTVNDARNGNTVSTGLQLPEDAALLRDTLRDHDIKLLIIDPITSCIDGNTDKRDDVRRSLDPLAALAQELEIAIIGILHFNKGAGYASDKVSGSHAFRDIVRSLILVAKDDETGECVTTLDKSSYTPQQETSYKYILQSQFITDGNGEQMEVPIVAGFTPTDRTVGDVINSNIAGGNNRRASNNDVTKWIINYIEKNGATPFTHIAEDAKKEEGYSAKQLQHARERSTSPRITTRKDPTYTGRGQQMLWDIERQ